MTIRRFNGDGIQAFKDFLADVRSGAASGPPGDLIQTDSLSAIATDEILVPPWNFPNRFTLGKALCTLFDEPKLRDCRRDTGVWTWLAAVYFTELCPDSDGVRRPGETARWIPEEGDFRKYYRHLLAGPERIYRAHRRQPEVAMAVLAQPAHRPGDVAEQLSARQERISNPTVMAVASRLYVRKRALRRGAAGRGPGSARRFAAVLNQLDLTWDLYDLEPEGLLRLLPAEFDAFRSSRRQKTNS